MKNEIVLRATTDERVANYKGGSKAALSALLQSEIGISPLAVGTKFETDDLVAADGVKLKDFDLVEYTEDEGGKNEKHVRFYVWAVEVSNKDRQGGYTVESGYYQGGTVMNKIAETIRRYNAESDLHNFGIDVKVEWGKTSSGNKIALVTVL